MNALCENNQNPKTMWNTIRTLTNKNSKTTNITEIHVEKDHSVTEPKQIADAFNTFFNNIGTQLADALPVTNITPESFITPANSSFEIHTVSIEKVFNLLSTIKVSKATGHDKISPKLLKDSADIIAPSLANIFNQSIKTGIFPDDMKTAVISPIFKSGNKTVLTIDQFQYSRQFPKSLRNSFQCNCLNIWNPMRYSQVNNQVSERIT